MNKYSPLETFLGNQPGDKVRFTYQELERIIGDTLPPSSMKYREWWANDKTHVQAQAWFNEGWKVEEVSLGEWVLFERK